MSEKYQLALLVYSTTRAPRLAISMQHTVENRSIYAAVELDVQVSYYNQMQIKSNLVANSRKYK